MDRKAATGLADTIGSHRVDRVLLACLAALIECGRTPDEIRAGWARVSAETGLLDERIERATQ